MKPTRSTHNPANSPLLIGLVFAFACIAVGYWSYVRQLAPQAGPAYLAGPPAEDPTVPPLEEPPATVTPVAVSNPVPVDSPAPVAPDAFSDPQNVERMGRVALAAVGTNPDAEKVWLFAINSPVLPAGTRKNLIEDLNQDGLSNPQSPTADDLPLIESRIALINRIAPAAMDEVNAAAFQEALKDLTAMRGKLP